MDEEDRATEHSSSRGSGNRDRGERSGRMGGSRRRQGMFGGFGDGVGEEDVGSAAVGQLGPWGTAAGEAGGQTVDPGQTYFDPGQPSGHSLDRGGQFEVSATDPQLGSADWDEGASAVPTTSNQPTAGQVQLGGSSHGDRSSPTVLFFPAPAEAPKVKTKVRLCDTCAVQY